MNLFSPELEWLDEYLSLAHTVIPKTTRLKKVKLVSPQTGKLCRVMGMITQQINGHYTMSLYMKYTSVVRLYPKPKVVLKKYSTIDILCIFAHELAHLEHWFHTPQHKMLEVKLTLLFMAKLSEKGYISEENEKINKRRIADDLRSDRCE